MKTWCILLLLISFAIHAGSTVGELIWEDNFDQKKLDLTKWSYETGTGLNGDWGTGQLDYATDRKRNVSIQFDVEGAEDGCLAITTRKDYYEHRKYSSGRINTKDKGAWGPGHRIMARVFPRDVRYPGQGFAFWMMPAEKPEDESNIMWPQGGEIDIMEYVGSIPFHNLGTVHYAQSWEDNQWHSWNHIHQGFYYNYEEQSAPSIKPSYINYAPEEEDTTAGSGGFHFYGIDWHEDRLEFFVDYNVYHIHYFNDGAIERDERRNSRTVTKKGKRIGQSEFSNQFDEWHPFENKMFIILSAGVGGSDRTYGGKISPKAKFPCTVFIDWVRVYKLTE